MAIKELTMTSGNDRNLNRKKVVLESSTDKLQEHMTRTIDNEKTQVCCKYKDSTSIIEMNKGNNYVHVSSINLLAAPVYKSVHTVQSSHFLTARHSGYNSLQFF